MALRYDRYSFFHENGERFTVRSGAMHYFRLPSQELWRDRLLKLKAAGYNTVDLYFSWAYHSPQEEEYHFEGARDVEALLALTQELGLYVIGRPGPYINAELSGGGFPGWLLAKKELALRCIKNDQHHWDEAYLAYVRQWWGHLLPRLAKAPNLLLLQIENEYVTEGLEPDYMQALYAMVREFGITVPLSHNDVYTFGCYADVVDLYAFDHYPTISFEKNWRHNPQAMLAIADEVDTAIRPFCENRPLYIAELQSGWFAPWKGASYETITSELGKEHARLLLKTLLANGVGIFNHYMAIGGSSWGYLGSTDSQTTYDFAAPIGETGHLKPHYYELKAINFFLEAFPLQAVEPVALESLPVSLSNSSCFYRCLQIKQEAPEVSLANLTSFSKKDTLPTNAHWLVLRNLQQDTETVNLSFSSHTQGSPTLSVSLPPLDVVYLPYQLRLASGHIVEMASTELLYQSASVLVIKGDRPAELFMRNEDGSQLEAFAFSELAPDGLHLSEFCGLKIISLGSLNMERLWVEADGALIIGPDIKVEDGHYFSTKACFPCFRITAEGNLIRFEAETAVPLTEPSTPTLAPWALRSADLAQASASPQFSFDKAGLISVSERLSASSSALPARTDKTQPLDMDSLAFYEGQLWYSVSLSRPVQHLHLLAKHNWIAYLNEMRLASGSTMQSSPSDSEAQPQPIAIPEGAYREAQANRLLFFTDFLGHAKGFFHDAQEPGGIIHLDLDGVAPVLEACSVAQPLDLALPENLAVDTGASSHLLAKTSFTLPAVMPHQQTLGLCFSGALAERIDIYCNGSLVGRFWSACGAQTRFSLHSAFLIPGQSNTLTLALHQFSDYFDSKQLKKNLREHVALCWLNPPVLPVILSESAEAN